LLYAKVGDAIERLHANRLMEHVDRLAYHARRGAVWESTYVRSAGRRHNPPIARRLKRFKTRWRHSSIYLKRRK
jgi:hypothetical protein